MPHFFDLVGFPQIVEWEKKYIPSSADKYKESSEFYDPSKSNKK